MKVACDDGEPSIYFIRLNYYQIGNRLIVVIDSF
jgi:hypothetical protein